MKKLILLAFLLPVSLIAQRSSNNVSVEVDPYTFMQFGNYEIDGNLDSGDYSAIGLGARVGVNTPHFWIGLDASGTWPSFKSDDGINSLDRVQYPLLDGQRMTSLGGGVILKLGSVGLSFSYFLDQKLEGDVNDGTTSTDFTYHGTGWKAGLDFNFYEVLHIFAEKVYTRFDQFEVDSAVGSITQTGKQDLNNNFIIDAWSIGVGFRLRFGSFGSLGSFNF